MSLDGRETGKVSGRGDTDLAEVELEKNGNISRDEMRKRNETIPAIVSFCKGVAERI